MMTHKLISSLAVISLLTAAPGIAANRIWTGADGDMRWDTEDNWENREIPGTGDTAYIGIHSSNQSIYYYDPTPGIPIVLTGLRIGDDNTLIQRQDTLIVIDGRVGTGGAEDGFGELTADKGSLLIQ